MFLLFGLVSGHKATRVAHVLNEQLAMNLERVPDLLLPDYNPQAEIGFSRFSWLDEENHLDYYLLTNKEVGLMLMPDLRQFDYLLIIRGGIEFFDSQGLIAKGMKISDIQLIASIEQERIRSKMSWMI